MFGNIWFVGDKACYLCDRWHFVFVYRSNKTDTLSDPTLPNPPKRENADPTTGGAGTRVWGPHQAWANNGVQNRVPRGSMGTAPGQRDGAKTPNAECFFCICATWGVANLSQNVFCFVEKSEQFIFQFKSPSRPLFLQPRHEHYWSISTGCDHWPKGYSRALQNIG